MNLDARGVQRDRFDLDAYDLRLLQLLEHPVEHARLRPAVHARVDRVPLAEALGQSSPLAAVFGHVQDCVDHLHVAQADVSSLRRQAVLDLGELFRRNLHARQSAGCSLPAPLV